MKWTRRLMTTPWFLLLRPSAASRKLGIRSDVFTAGKEQRRFKVQRDMNQVCGVAEAQFMDTQAHKWPLRPHVHTAIPSSAICLGDVTKKSLAGPTVEHMFGDNQLPSVNRWNLAPPSDSLALIFTFSLFLWGSSAAIYCPWRVGQVSQTAA